MNNLIDIEGLVQALNSMGGLGDFNSGNLDTFRKALTATSGYTGYNLEREVKFRLPSYTVLRNRVAVDAAPLGAMAGPQAHFKMQLGYNGFDFSGAMGTAFGANGSDGNPSATDIGADYKSQSIHGAVQLESIDFGRGFTDPIKDQSMFNLQTLMRLEELIVMGGNEAAITMTTLNAGQQSTLATPTTFGLGVWTYKVTALTLQGALANASANSNVGESVAATGTITVAGTAAAFLDISWPVVPGAFGYKIYMNAAAAGGAAAVYLVPLTGLNYRKITAGGLTDLTALGDPILPETTGQTFVTVNHVQVSAVGVNTNPIPPAVDGSANANLFEGYWAWCTKTTMYGVSLTGAGQRVFTDLNGAPLTAENSGIKEINQALQSLYLLYHTAPTAMVGSPQTIRSITNKLTGNNNTSMMLVGNQGGNLQQQNKLIGGIMVGGYTNAYAQHVGMSPMIDIIAHPYMPDGSLMLLSETLPPDTYRFAQDSRCFALDVLRPYNYFPLASTDRNINFDIWFLETLKCYYPTAQAALSGIRVDG